MPRKKSEPEKRGPGRPPRHGAPMVRKSIQLPAELWLELDRESLRLSKPGDRISVNELIRRRLGRP
jgi:hypothetical protein